MKPPILVVDDDSTIRRMLREILEMEGFTVQTAEHGGPALDILRASSEGMVVLLGLVMPNVDGEEVLETLAANEELASRHRFIMVTGSSERAATGRVAKLREHLGVPLVNKPFALEQIVTAVEEAMLRLNAGARARSRQRSREFPSEL